MHRRVISPILCIILTGIITVSINTLTSNIAMSTASTQTLTLQVASILPQDGVTLTNFPANLEIKVTRGGFPVQGARVQFWMEGGSADAAMHNAGLTVTDSSGYAHLTLLNKNTLDTGQYLWYATAYKTGFKGGSSQVVSFTIPFTESSGKSTTSGGTVTTDQKEYSTTPGIGANVIIYGNANNYHLGEPVVIKITSPSGKTVQLVTYGTYLGAFQTVYKLGQDAKAGPYTVTVYHNYVVSSTYIFYLVK